MGKGQESDGRARIWGFLLYPESAVPNWRDVLSEMQVSAAVSPLHDKDVNPTGEVKKAHYHVIMSFDGKKSYEQIFEITNELRATIPQRCRSVKGSVRYFTHMDNPEKAQYSRSDIVTFNGFDIEDVFKQTQSERLEILLEIHEFLINNEVIEYRALYDYAANKQRERWYPVVVNNTFVLKTYINSCRHSRGEKGE